MRFQPHQCQGKRQRPGHGRATRPCLACVGWRGGAVRLPPLRPSASRERIASQLKRRKPSSARYACAGCRASSRQLAVAPRARATTLLRRPSASCAPRHDAATRPPPCAFVYRPGNSSARPLPPSHDEPVAWTAITTHDHDDPIRAAPHDGSGFWRGGHPHPLILMRSPILRHEGV